MTPNIPRPHPRGRGWTAALVVLVLVALALWPLAMAVTAVLLLPAAALAFPILDSGRLSDRTAWRLFALYGGVALGASALASLTMFPSFFPAILLFPFFASLLVLLRESVSPTPRKTS